METGKAMIGTYTATGGHTHTPDPHPHAQCREVAAMVTCLPPAYRATLWLHLGGATQAEIAAAQGLSRPGVALRLRRVRRWLRRCAPLRAQLRAQGHVLSDAADASLLAAVLWHHQSVSELARRSGWSPGTLERRWRGLRARLGLPAVVGSRRWVLYARAK
jgi:hypothetical protein